MSIAEKMRCKNCGQKISGEFCSHCGQSCKVGKLTFATLLNGIVESVFQVNRGFFYTLKELFVRPGHSIREYLDGKRKRHFKPIAYVLTFSTVYFLLSRLTGGNTWMEDLILGYSSGINGEEIASELPSFFNWFAKNFPYATLLLLPVFSLASYFSFYQRSWNYVEHIVLNSYITGQQAIFYSFFLILKMFIDLEILESIPVVLSILYTIWVFRQFFDQGSRVANILRSLLTYFIYLILSFGLMSINLAGQ